MAGLEWYEAKSVQYHLRDYSQTRPIIMAYSNGKKKFFRPILFATTDVALKWMRYFGFPKSYPHIYQSCLTFDYKKIPELPPALPNAAMVAPPRRSPEQHRIYQEYIDNGQKGKKAVEESLENHFSVILASAKDIDHGFEILGFLQDHIEYRLKHYTKCISKSTDNYFKYLLETYNRQLSQKIRTHIHSS